MIITIVWLRERYNGQKMNLAGLLFWIVSNPYKILWITRAVYFWIGIRNIEVEDDYLDWWEHI